MNINNISANYLNQISVNQHLSGAKPRLSGGTGKKAKKTNNGAVGNNPMVNTSNLSMVLVMNNMVQKRKGQVGSLPKTTQKRGNSSSNPATQYRPQNQRMNEFYFWLNETSAAIIFDQQIFSCLLHPELTVCRMQKSYNLWC